MKRHILNFMLLAFLEVCACGGLLFFGIRYRKLSSSQDKQITIMRLEHTAFIKDQASLAVGNAGGVNYRDYMSKWEARTQAYNAPSKVVEILNAEASRAGINPPTLNEAKAGANSFDVTTYGRVNELNHWIAAIESRIDLLSVDEMVFTSQNDATLSLVLKAKMIGGFEVKPTVDPTAPRAAGSAVRAPKPKK